MHPIDSRWDVLLRGALVFDGSGAAPQKLDVALQGERIVAMAAHLEGADARTVRNLHGQWLLPGLLDIHTHLDLEVELAPGLPEVVRHGTTTVVMSNCSLGVAFGNQRRNGEDPITDCFARVENIPKPVLRAVGDACTWDTSAAYLEHLEQLRLGPNVVPLIPHSMLRVEVMGLQASVDRDPSADELARMEALLEQGMAEGYAGFSTDALPFHFLANQPNTRKQIPTQFAPFAEIKRLTGVVRRHGRVWQATPPKDSRIGILRTFLLSSGRLHRRPLKTTAVAALDVHTNRSLIRMALLVSRLLNGRLLNGMLRLQALAAPFKVYSDGPITPLAEEVPALRRLNEFDLDDRSGRRAVLDDAGFVQDFRAMWFHGKRGFGPARLKRWLRLEDNVLTRDLRDMVVTYCPLPNWDTRPLQDAYERLLQWQRDGSGAETEEEAQFFAVCPRPIGDDAAFFLHLLRMWDTDLHWWTITANRDPRRTRELLFNPLLIPGFNDSGAHLTNMAFYDANLRFLRMAQEDGTERVARAVHRLTQEPAELFGLNAGVLRVGAQADLCVIDPQALAAWDPDTTQGYIWRELFDHAQMVNRPEGVVTHTFIGGHLAWHNGAFTPAFERVRMGRLLRHRDHPAEAAWRGDAPAVAAPPTAAA